MNQTCCKKPPLWFYAFQSVAAAVAMFTVWCGVDYYEVNRPDYPESIHDRSWQLVLLPTSAIATAVLILKISPFKQLFINLLLIGVISLILGFLLIWTLGISFHFWIGGRL